jgi:hypothetical protein
LGFVRGACVAALALLLVGLPAPAAQARAEPVLHIWYRSSEGCPDGAEFMRRLERFGRAAALANVGDPVDFVVTLAFAPAVSSGRLERQSARGTVAIRELSAASCAEVAEGLALSLELAGEPPTDRGPEPDLLVSSPSSAARTAVALGAQLGAEQAVSGRLLPGGALFAELALGDVGSARLSLRGAHGSGESDVIVSLGLVRAEGCARVWGPASGDAFELSLFPCLGVDLGLVQGDSRADNAQRQRGLWVGATGHLRGVFPLGAALALEAQAGVLVPFTRYRFSTETGRQLSDTAAVGAQAMAGVSFSL